MAITTKWEQDFNGILFDAYEIAIFPPELINLIKKDVEILSLVKQSHEISKRYYQRIDEIKRQNGLEYSLNELPKWVENSKFIKPYLNQQENPSLGIQY